MSFTPLVLSIFVANLVLSQTHSNAVSEVKSVQWSSTESIFALQIRQIRTSDAPAASAGNNLNVFSPDDGANNFLEAHGENFRAISPFHPIGETSAGEKIKNDHGGNSKLLSTLEANFLNEKKSDFRHNKIYDSQDTENLIWDNCFETVNDLNTNSDAENSHDLESDGENARAYGNYLNKRDFLSSNESSALRDMYNILKSGRSEQPTISTDTASAEYLPPPNTSSVQIIPITSSLPNSYTDPINITLDIITEHNLRDPNSVDWYINDDNSKIQFGSLPQSQTYLIPKFKFDEGFHPFSFMSKFFSVIHLFDYPIGESCYFFYKIRVLYFFNISI